MGRTFFQKGRTIAHQRRRIRKVQTGREAFSFRTDNDHAHLRIGVELLEVFR